MGTWGHGNLDSDYALDELSTRTDELLTELLLRMQRKHSREWDEYDHTTLFVEFEIVFALDDKRLLSASSFPSGAAIRELATGWLRDYDDFIDEPWPQRRAKIVETFERFAALCDKHEGKHPLPVPAAKPRPIAAQATTPPVAKPKPKARASARSRKGR